MKKNTPLKVHLEIDLSHYGKFITNDEELNEYLSNRWYGDNEKENIYRKYKNYIDNGQIIWVGEFSDEDGDSIESYIRDNGLPPSDNYQIIAQES